MKFPVDNFSLVETSSLNTSQFLFFSNEILVLKFQKLPIVVIILKNQILFLPETTDWISFKKTSLHNSCSVIIGEYMVFMSSILYSTSEPRLVGSDEKSNSLQLSGLAKLYSLEEFSFFQEGFHRHQCHCKNIFEVELQV